MASKGITEKKSAAQTLLNKTQEDVWARGQEYVKNGNVKITAQDEKRIEAAVSGKQEYQVSLTFMGGGLSKKCTCPSRFLVCKHIVAVALVWDETRSIQVPEEHIVKRHTIPKPARHAQDD